MRIRKMKLLVACSGMCAALLVVAGCSATSQSVITPADSANTTAFAGTISATGEWVPDEAAMALQPTINSYVTKIVGPTYGTGEGNPGLGGVSIDLRNRTVLLAWKGPPPKDVQTFIDNPPAGVKVVITSAAYSMAELIQASRVLATSSVVKATGYEWEAIAGEATGMRLDAKVYPEKGTATTEQLKALEPTFTSMAGGVPVHLEPGSKQLSAALKPVKPADSPAWPTGPRWSAGSPYGGGAAIAIGNDQNGWGHCTSSFVGTTSFGNSAVTANHCTNGNWANGQKQPYATTVRAIDTRDTQLLDFNRGSLAPFVYDGSYNGEKTRPIADAAFTFEGDYICSGGSMSGQHCNVLGGCPEFRGTSVAVC